MNTTARHAHASPMEVLFSVIAALSAFAVAVGSPASYILNIDQVSFGVTFTVNLIAYATLAFEVYEVSNALSGVTPQRSYGLNVLDTFFSALAFVSLNFTLGWIVVQYLVGGGSAANIIYIFGGVQPLIGATVFSWVDVGYIQRRKWQLYRAQLEGGTDTGADDLPVTRQELANIVRRLAIAMFPSVTDAGLAEAISRLPAGSHLINISPRND